MILDNGDEFTHHMMMDWELGNWIYIILGLGIILLILLILGFIFLYNNRKSMSNHKYIQNNVQKQRENEISDNTFQKVNFCYNCGRKLDDSQSKYCSFCGIQI